MFCRAWRKLGFSFMTNSDQINKMDFELIAEVVKRIPEHTWDLVKDTLITHFIDSMPSQVFIELTGDPLGFEKAEELLHNYYAVEATKEDLIIDAFKILGDDYVLTVLENLELDKVKQL
jgi:hypothetical protein